MTTIQIKTEDVILLGKVSSKQSFFWGGGFQLITRSLFNEKLIQFWSARGLVFEKLFLWAHICLLAIFFYFFSRFRAIFNVGFLFVLRFSSFSFEEQGGKNLWACSCWYFSFALDAKSITYSIFLPLLCVLAHKVGKMQLVCNYKLSEFQSNLHLIQKMPLKNINLPFKTL